jgi:hypothetical protein
VINAPERVEVPKKTTHAPSVVKRGVAQTKKDKTPNKHPRKEKMIPLQKTVNVSQPRVVYTLWIFHNLALKHAIEMRMLAYQKNHDALVLGNHEASTGMQEISINYTSFEEVYDRSTTIVNPYFSTVIAENFLADPDPKIMEECKWRSDWNWWKEAIEAELNSIKKRNVFTDVVPTPLRIFRVGLKWVFIRK